LRFAGYDGIIVRGRSPKPVYLWVQDGQAELREAGHLWGKDTFEAQAIIKEELGDPRVRVACIGPAGDNQGCWPTSFTTTPGQPGGGAWGR
jgi:aldehyde:ferredoxin oxidoreductase